MLAYVVRRLLHAVLVVVGVATVVFCLARLSGDPAKLLLPPDATLEQLAVLRAQLGLDRPVWVQYADYMASLARLDLGESLYFEAPVWELIVERLPATLFLGGAALLIALAVAVPAGLLAATRRGSFVEGIVQIGVLIGQSTPPFWVGIVLILIFSVNLGMFPTGGMSGYASLVLPAVTLAFYLMAMMARLLRSSMLDVLHEDYIRSARAKGASGVAVITRHAMRNAMIPTVTVLGLEIGGLFGGAVVTENVFAWPGVGSLIVEAINNRDYPLAQGIVVVLAVIFVLVNLLVDLFYSVLDPRVAYQ
ncbi:MAG TPA: ABC transporter permease [Pseudonocardia sp.]|nr:ABC transporter permease [Pseudonocardia sp.]